MVLSYRYRVRYFVLKIKHMNISKLSLIILVAGSSLVACKKKGCTDPTALNYNAEAKKNDNSCEYDLDPVYDVPSNYYFADANGNSTVDFSGQTTRLDQLDSIIEYMKTGQTTTLDAQAMKDMFSNNGVWPSTTKQLRDKCFSIDQTMFDDLLDNMATTSLSNGMTASNGQAGIATSLSGSTYLLDANGFHVREVFEKGIMGAVFMYQALNNYFGDTEMNVDNTTAVDAANNKYYTLMEHHWDEAFGYFGVDVNFPTVPADRFWGEYCQAQNANLNSNADMMNNFLKGRAAIVANVYDDRDAAIQAIRLEWEEIAAGQAVTYINAAIGYFGTDNAKFLHALSEAYGFAWSLRYAPLETTRISNSDHTALMNLFGTNLWNITVQDLNDIKAAINAAY